MKTKTKIRPALFFNIAALSVLGALQTGCIATAGISEVIYMINYNSNRSANWNRQPFHFEKYNYERSWPYDQDGFDWGAFFLDKQNPGYLVALNRLPLSEDLASRLGIKIETLSDYNDSLGEIFKLNQTIEAALKSYRNGTLDESQQNALAISLGMTDAQELRTVLTQDVLNPEQIAKIAKADNRTLSPEVTALYLQTRFNIKTKR